MSRTRAHSLTDTVPGMEGKVCRNILEKLLIRRKKKLTGVVVVVLLEAQRELGAMGEEFLLQGSESRTFCCSDPAEKNTRFFVFFNSGSVSTPSDVCRAVAPLCQGESARRAADSVLVKAGHQFSVHFDVRAAVASLLIVIRS